MAKEELLETEMAEIQKSWIIVLRKHQRLIIIVISILPLSFNLPKTKKKKKVLVFSELLEGLILTFAVPFLFTIFKLKGKLPPFAHNSCSPFVITGAGAYDESDEFDNSFDEGLEDLVKSSLWSIINAAF